MRRTDSNATKDKWHNADRIRNEDGTYVEYTGTPMTCVFDSWSDYNNEMISPSGTFANALQSKNPPYEEPIKGLQITIRCFEPQSGAIKQIRVVRKFD